MSYVRLEIDAVVMKRRDDGQAWLVGRVDKHGKFRGQPSWISSPYAAVTHFLELVRKSEDPTALALVAWAGRLARGQMFAPAATLKTERRRTGISQRKLAKLSGVNRRTIQRIEAGGPTKTSTFANLLDVLSHQPTV